MTPELLENNFFALGESSKSGTDSIGEKGTERRHTFAVSEY